MPDTIGHRATDADTEGDVSRISPSDTAHTTSYSPSLALYSFQGMADYGQKLQIFQPNMYLVPPSCGGPYCTFDKIFGIRKLVDLGTMQH